MKPFDSGCCGGSVEQGKISGSLLIQPSMEEFKKTEAPIDPLKDHDKPGYRLCSFVRGFLKTDVGLIPRVKTDLDKSDLLSTVMIRAGIKRHDYRISPGLYAVGTPDKYSEVLVTANFKLTFDHLRRELNGLSAWILVLDTNGVNVWCAAGKKTFSTHELVNRIKTVSLSELVTHGRVIVPQLGATGVSAVEVKKRSGFEVVFGPVRAKDIPLFLRNNRKADERMRTVTFSFFERLILTPVELKLIVKPVLITAIVLFVISGIGPGLFSISQAGSRGLAAVFFLFAGILSGAVITPTFLPFIPFREFAAKGIISGGIFAAVASIFFSPPMAGTTALMGLSLLTVTSSSILAMQFTGATPFTSPSGVEKEMRRFIPAQAVGLLSATGLWIYSAF